VSGSGDCLNCGRELVVQEGYCPACGQRALPEGARTFGHLVRTSLREVASFDSRLLRSLGLLFVRPGFLSLEYQRGRRRRYLSPIGLFLLANLVFFVAPPVTDLSVSLEDQYHLQPYSDLIAPWIEAVLTRTGLEFGELAAAYQLRVSELAKLMAIVHVPPLAAALMLLTLDRRYYYADHVVVCLHFFAFLMLYFALVEFGVGPLLSAVDALLPLNGVPIRELLLSVTLVYMAVMLRRALALSWWRTLPTVAAFLAALAVIHGGYRLLQFVLAFWSVSL